MNGDPKSFAAPAAFFVGARLANMAVGLAMIPLLIHFLGGIGFATWAILLSLSIVFAELQLGIPTALTREVAIAPEPSATGLWSSAAVLLIGIYSALMPLVALVAFFLGDWLRLPLVGAFRPGTAILAV